MFLFYTTSCKQCMTRRLRNSCAVLPLPWSIAMCTPAWWSCDAVACQHMGHCLAARQAAQTIDIDMIESKSPNPLTSWPASRVWASQIWSAGTAGSWSWCLLLGSSSQGKQSLVAGHSSENIIVFDPHVRCKRFPLFEHHIPTFMAPLLPLKVLPPSAGPLHKLYSGPVTVVTRRDRLKTIYSGVPVDTYLNRELNHAILFYISQSHPTRLRVRKRKCKNLYI